MKKINFLVMLLLLISFFLSQSSQVYAAENVSDEIITLKPNETYDLENNRIVEMYALKDTVQTQNMALEVAGLGSIAAFLAANPLLSLGILLLGIAAIAVGVRFKSYLDAYDFGKKVRQLLSDAQFAAAIAGNNIVYTGPLILAIQKLRYQNIGLVEDDSINKYVRYHADNLKQLDIEESLGVGSIIISNSQEGIYDTTFCTKSITCDITRSTGFTSSEIRKLKEGFGSKYNFVNMYPYYESEIKSDYIRYYGSSNPCFGTVTEISNGYRLYFDSDMMNCSRSFLVRFTIGNDSGYSAKFVGVDVSITFSNGKCIKLYGDVSPYNKYHLLDSTASANLDNTYTVNTNANVSTQTVNADTFKQLSNYPYAKTEADLMANPTYLSNVTEYSATAADIPVDDAGSSDNSEEDAEEKNEIGWLSKIFSLLKTFLSTLQKSVDDIGNFVKSIPDFILSIPEKISLALGEFVAGIQGIFDNLTNLVREIFQWLKDFFIPDFSSINNSISNVKNKFDEKFKSITNSISSFKSIFSNGKSIYDLELTIFDTSFHPVPIVVKPVIDVARTLFNAFIMFLAFNNVRKRFFGDGDAIAT